MYGACVTGLILGAMSIDCRTRMEIEATEEVVSYVIHGIQNNSVPHEALFLSGVIE